MRQLTSFVTGDSLGVPKTTSVVQPLYGDLLIIASLLREESPIRLLASEALGEVYGGVTTVQQMK